MIVKTPGTTGSHNHVHGLCLFLEMRNSSPKPAPTSVANKGYGISSTGFTNRFTLRLSLPFLKSGPLNKTRLGFVKKQREMAIRQPTVPATYDLV